MSFVIISLCVLQTVLSIDIEDGSSTRDARKLFGGYRITPRYCKPTRDVPIDLNGPSICMFNHECTQRNGLVVGACMDGFLFGACCQLPEGAAGELIESDARPAIYPENGLYKPTKAPTGIKVTPTMGHITSHGVSQITSALLNGMLPTAQDNAVVQVDHDQFSTTGVTHPTAPDTILQNNYNEIRPEDFKPSSKPVRDKETTVRAEWTTPSYGETSPYFQVSVSGSPPHYSIFPSQSRPVFRPKPSPPSNTDKYVLVPTITHTTKPNRTQDYESIVNIIQMLNGSTSYYTSTSTQKYGVSTTKRPPSTSYVFSAKPTRRPGFEPQTTKKRPTSSVYSSTSSPSRPGYTDRLTSKNPPSTSYIFSTIPPVKKPGFTQHTTQNKPSTYTYATTFTPTKIKIKRPTTNAVKNKYTTSTSRPSYASSSTFRPGHSTFANSPDAFVTTKKPPSTSYVFSTTLSKRPTTNAATDTVANYAPTYHATLPPSLHSSYPTPSPTVIVLSPITPEYTTPTPTVNSQSNIPQRKPVSQVTINNHITHNIYSTSEKPSPTILITPKPSTTTHQYRPSDFDSVTVEAATSPNDLNNFPPVRNPNLNMSVTVFDEDDVNSPQFIEDEALNIKVESFVNKIIQGLQEPFNGLKAVVYNKNKTSVDVTTKKPVKKQGSTTKKPVTKPGVPKPTQQKFTTRRPATTVITKRPTLTSRRTKPTKRVTTSLPSTEQDTVSTTSQDYRHACGVRPLVKTGRIVGGKGATFGEFPWQVLVRESTWLGLFTKNKCGGVLINNRYVMTAAHCQPGFLASLVTVFGEFDISGDLESKRPISRNVKRVIVHRLYDPATFENDLALLEMEHPVQFDQHIVPICLPREAEDFTGRMATVTGWGRLKYGGGVPSVLQEVQVPIMENHVCQEMFRTAGHSKVILESFLCAGYANGQKDSCEGDSGGPLVLQRPDGRYQLAGTVSHGIKCAAPYLPGVYMRTAYYKPWIESITGIH